MSKGTWLAPGDRARVVQLLKDGAGVRAVANAVGCCPKTVRRIAIKEQLLRNPLRPPIDWTEAMDATLTRMLDEKASNKKMGAAVGHSASAVRDRLKKLGLTRVQAEAQLDAPHDETDWQRSMRERGVSAERIALGVHSLRPGSPVSWPFSDHAQSSAGAP